MFLGQNIQMLVQDLTSNKTIRIIIYRSEKVRYFTLAQPFLYTYSSELLTYPKPDWITYDYKLYVEKKRRFIKIQKIRIDQKAACSYHVGVTNLENKNKSMI